MSPKPYGTPIKRDTKRDRNLDLIRELPITCPKSIKARVANMEFEYGELDRLNRAYEGYLEGYYRRPALLGISAHVRQLPSQDDAVLSVLTWNASRTLTEPYNPNPKPLNPKTLNSLPPADISLPFRP